jgi:hypothetical protein
MLGALSEPSSLRVANSNTFAPGTIAERSVGANETTGALVGTKIFFSPSFHPAPVQL